MNIPWNLYVQDPNESGKTYTIEIPSSEPQVPIRSNGHKGIIIDFSFSLTVLLILKLLLNST